VTITDPTASKGTSYMMNGLVATPPEYPAELERTVTLPNGAHIRLRPILPEDEPRLVELHERLSAETVYRRFFTVMRALPSELAHHFANVDYRRRLALVAEPLDGDADGVIGVARLEPTERPTTAELALVVEDAWQGIGLGTILLAHILEAGEQRGSTDFRADVLTSNPAMMRLLATHTDVARRCVRQDGVTEIFFRRRPR
jgi:acetyltransferase